MGNMTDAHKMPDAGRRPITTATLDIRLTGDFATSIYYDAQKGEMAASIETEGYVWNTDSAFQFAECSVNFRRHATGRLPEFACEHGLDGACGSIELAAHLEPETFDDAGDEVALPPIAVYIILDGDGFDQIAKLLRAYLPDDHEVSLSLRFSHRDFASPVYLMALRDLDLSAKLIYPVVGFNVGSTRQPNTTVRTPKYKRDVATTAGLTFAASGASIQASLSNSKFSITEIRLTGKLQGGKFGLSSDDDTLEIREYEENQGWRPGYPKEAFPGTVLISKEEAVTYCWVTLYATKEVLRQLAALLSGMSTSDTVSFDVSVIAEGLPLALGERKTFDVTGWAPTFWKSYA